MKQSPTLLSLLGLYPARLAAALAAILASALLGLAFPWALKTVIDTVLVDKNTVLLNTLCAGLVAVCVLKFLTGYAREYLVAYIGEHVIARLRTRLTWHLQRLSVSYADSASPGRVISRIMSDIDSVRAFLFGGCVDFVYAGLDVVFVTALLLLLNWRLALVSFVFLPVCFIVYLKLNPVLKLKHEAVREKYAILTERLHEMISGMRVAAGFGLQKQESLAFSSLQQELVRATMGTHTLGMAAWLGSEFLASVGLVLLIWMGSRAVISDSLTPGELMAFYSYLGMLFFPVVKMSMINHHYQEARASMGRIRAFLNEEPRVKEDPHPVVLKGLKGNVTFEGVSFGYDPARRVLEDISLQVRQGEVVALVGKSGAGKTTLVNLITRFYDPDAGRVCIDGIDLRTLCLESYRSRLAFVLQDDYLFDASVRDNVLYSNPDASHEVLRAACLRAGAQEFIEKLARGYDTIIGPRGAKLSYGQRQRLSIARAIVRDPGILILDEATSNVDSETERTIIGQAYQNLVRGRTTFIIAHRLCAVESADTILFLEKGAIVEHGTHAALLARRGRYWELWMQQHASGAVAVGVP